MRQFVQLDTGRPSKFGVQAKYVDRELHLVDDALAGRLHFAPELKIGRSVIQFVTVFVMNVFAFEQFAAKHLRHDDAMLKSDFASSKTQPFVTGSVNVAIRVYRSPFSAFVTALFAAKSLAFVVGRMLSVQRLHQAAFTDFAAKLALKSRGWFLVHEAWLPPFSGLVKEHG